MYLELFNALTFTLGLVLIGVGFFLAGQKAQVYDLYGPTFPMALLIVISVGITIAALVSDTSFYKSRSSAGSCQILIFILLIVLILSLELAAAIAGLALPGYIQGIASLSIQQQISNYPKLNATSSTIIGEQQQQGERQPWIDIVQRSFQCCGVNGSSDWSRHRAEPPASCCATVISGGCNASSLYPAGCDSVIRAWLNGEIRVFAAAATGVFLLQLVGLVTTLYKNSTWRPKLPPIEEESSAKSDSISKTR